MRKLKMSEVKKKKLEVQHSYHVVMWLVGNPMSCRLINTNQYTRLTAAPGENCCLPYSPFHCYVCVSPTFSYNLPARGPSVHTSKISLTTYKMAHMDLDALLPALLLFSRPFSISQ